MSLNRKLVSDNAVHCRFLAALLYLISPEKFLSGFENQSSDWAKLSTAVKASVEAVLNCLREAKEEIECCKLVMKRQSALLESAAHLHEETLIKHEVEDGEREKQWERRLAELKKSYESMLMAGGGKDVDVQSQFRGQFHMLEELRKVNLQLELSKSSLSSQLARAKGVQKVYKNDRACLLSCVCLVAGNLFASQRKIQQLRFQKQLLLRLYPLQKLHSLRAGYTQDHSSQDKSLFSQERCVRGIVYFRILVIVVLAVCKFRRLKSRSLRLSSDKCNRLSMPVYIGLKNNRSNSIANPSEAVATNRDIARWLRSERVLLDVRECFLGLQSSLDVHSMHQHSKLKLHRSSSTLSKDMLGKRDVGFETLVMGCLVGFLNKISCHF